MRTSKISAKKLAAALAPLALAGAVIAPAASASTPPVAQNAAATQSKVGYSRGFHIYNYTSQPITLTKITGSGNFEGRPADGSVLNPGSSQDIEVQVRALDPQDDTAVYNNGDIQVGMSVDGVGDPSVHDFQTPGGYGSIDGTNVYVLDAPGTVDNLGPAQKQQQADVLNQLCDAGVATCTFTPTAESHILGADHVVGEAAVNPGNFDMNTTIEAKDSVSETDSVGVELTAGVEDGVVAEVTAKYEHAWSKEHDFSQSFEVTVPSHMKVWFTHQAPIIRDTGDFTVKLGNTTWNLTGVYFDTPDLTAQAQVGQYTPHQAPASQQELTYAAAHPGQLVPLS